MLSIKLPQFITQRLAQIASFALVAPVGIFSLAPVAALAAPISTLVAHQEQRPGTTQSDSAQVHITLTQSAATLAPGTAFTYNLTISNDGPGTANGVWVDVPLNANIAVDDFSSSNGSTFVQSLTADDLTIQVSTLDMNNVVTAQISAHVLTSAPSNLTPSGRATIYWNDSHPDMSAMSNDLANLSAAGTTTAVKPTALQLGVDSAVDAGTLLTAQANVFAGDEHVSLWLNIPTGATIPADSLGQSDTTVQGSAVGLDYVGWADSQGMLTYTVDTTGLPSGTYSLVAHGWDSGIEAVGTFTIK